MAQGGDAPFQGGKEPPPPTWDGSEPGLDLANFEKNVKLWEYESELDPKKRGVRLLRNLTGVARSVGDTLEFEEVACEKGVANIMTALKAHFAPHLEVSLPRAFERAIYGQPRSHKESMQEYLIRSERNFHLLEKEKLKLPDEAMGYVTYRQAALTESQDLKFTTWSNGKFDYKTVAACLRKLEKVIPEHRSKNSSTFVQDNEMDAEQTVDSDWVDPDLLSDDAGQWVLIEESEAEQVWDEAEVQVALATYQEVRKAINAHQKNRQYYGGKGESRGSMGYKAYMKGKKKIRIEELKLRTKCGRCGLVGHWAKECKNAPDQRGRAALSSASGASGASQHAASTAGSQQSWYVSAGSMCPFVVSSSAFCNLQCFGVSTEGNCKLGSILADEDTIVDGRPLKGLDVFRSLKLGSHRIRPLECSQTAAFFVGLTTNPSMAVVDTAAQDGLIGSLALARLKEQLSALGLQVVWTGRQAKAHGVGGAAKVLGIVAIPLGIAKSSGVLEATVVEGEVPLLLPVKLLKHLQAVIDVDELHLFFRRLGRSVPLFALPSGHVAVEILDFGKDGFVCPSDMSAAGYKESDFRIPCGPMPISGDVMLSQASIAAFPSVGHGSPLQISSGFRWNAKSRNATRSGSSPKFEESSQELAHCAGQGVCSAGVDWCRSIGELVVAGYSGECGAEALSAVFGAARRHCRRLRDAPKVEVEAHASQGDGGVFTSEGTIDGGGKPTCRVGDMCRLSWKMEGSKCLQASEAPEADGEVCIEFQGGVQPRPAAGDSAPARRVSFKGCSAKVHSRSAAGYASECAFRDGGQEPSVEVARDDEDRVRQYGTGPGVPPSPRLSRQRDAHLCRESPEVLGGGAAPRRSSDESERRDCRDGETTSERFGSSQKCFIEGSWCEKGGQNEKQSTWVRLKRPTNLREKVKEFGKTGLFAVAGIFVEESEALLEVKDEAELDFEDECLVKVQETLRGRCEDEVEEAYEAALPRKLKKQLRKAFSYLSNRSESEQFPVAVSEVYSQPRISVEAAKRKLSTGGSYDLLTGFDLRLKKDLERMWNELFQDDPELVTCSPPCRPFSLLQELNFPKMLEESVIELVGEGLHHVGTSVHVCRWQYERGKLFFFEHPLTSKVWQEDEVQALQSLPGVITCDLDMCRFGLSVDGGGLNQKPTRVLVNSKAMARELQKRCTRDHVHEHLMGGKAVKAAHYTPAFCKAVVKGLQTHLRERDGRKHALVSEDEIVVLAVADEVDPLEELPELEDELQEVVREENPERLEVAVNKEDEAKVRKLHVNLGHPSKPSFLRFLKAGRVRNDCSGSAEASNVTFVRETASPKHLVLLWFQNVTLLELQLVWMSSTSLMFKITVQCQC